MASGMPCRSVTLMALVVVLFLGPALSTVKRGGVDAVQIHTGHVQERPVTAQYHAPNLFPLAVPRPLAEMGIHTHVAQNPPREDG